MRWAAYIVVGAPSLVPTERLCEMMRSYYETRQLPDQSGSKYLVFCNRAAKCYGLMLHVDTQPIPPLSSTPTFLSLTMHSNVHAQHKLVRTVMHDGSRGKRVRSNPQARPCTTSLLLPAGTHAQARARTHGHQNSIRGGSRLRTATKELNCFKS